MLCNMFCRGCQQVFNSYSTTEFCIVGLRKQLSKIDNTHLPIPLNVHETLVLFWWTSSVLTFSDQISSLSKSCYSHICELRCIRLYADSKTANTIDTSIVHCKLDHCNSLYSHIRQRIDGVPPTQLVLCNHALKYVHVVNGLRVKVDLFRPTAILRALFKRRRNLIFSAVSSVRAVPRHVTADRFRGRRKSRKQWVGQTKWNTN